MVVEGIKKWDFAELNKGTDLQPYFSLLRKNYSNHHRWDFTKRKQRKVCGSWKRAWFQIASKIKLGE